MTRNELNKLVDEKNYKEIKKSIENGNVFLIKESIKGFNGNQNVLLTKTEFNEYTESKRLKGVFHNIQWATKILLNSLYGALGTKYCRYMDFDLAKSITLTGQSIIKGNGQFVHDYLTNDIFNEKAIKKNFKNIDKDYKFDRSPSVYTDTDSCVSNTIINSNLGDIRIDDLYNNYEEEVEVDLSNNGHEVLDVKNSNLQVLTFDSKQEKVKMGKVDKIIRHKVSKSKWVLKSKCGKEVITTGDHSLMVKRNGKLIEVKPCEVNKKTDKLVVLK